VIALPKHRVHKALLGKAEELRLPCGNARRYVRARALRRRLCTLALITMAQVPSVARADSVERDLPRRTLSNCWCDMRSKG
jgi:hypothetical protein